MTLLRLIFPRGDSKAVLPCNMERIVWNAQKIFNLNRWRKSDLLPSEIVNRVRELRRVPKNDSLEKYVKNIEYNYKQNIKYNA